MKEVEISVAALKSVDQRTYRIVQKMLDAGWSETRDSYSLTDDQLIQAGLDQQDLRYVNCQWIPLKADASEGALLFGNSGLSFWSGCVCFSLSHRLIP